jgi:hypothetical protein
LFRWRIVAILCVALSDVGFSFFSHYVVINVLLQVLAISAFGFEAYAFRTLDLFFSHRGLLTENGLEVVAAGTRAKEALSPFGKKLLGLYVDWQYTRCTCYGNVHNLAGKLEFLFQRSDNLCPVHSASYSPLVDIQPVESEQEVHF